MAGAWGKRSGSPFGPVLGDDQFAEAARLLPAEAVRIEVVKDQEVGHT